MEDLERQDTKDLRTAIAHALRLANDQNRNVISAMLADALYFAEGGSEYAWSVDSGQLPAHPDAAFRFAPHIQSSRAKGS